MLWVDGSPVRARRDAPTGPTEMSGPVGVGCCDDVNVVVTGDGPGTVVLLHGFSDNLTTWRRIVAPLAARYRVIALDLPGFGRSERAWGRPLLDGYVACVAEVLDALDVDGPVTLIGNSMGAAVATVFAGRHPERTDRVVLIDMPGLAGVPRYWDFWVSRPAEVALRTTLRLVPGSLPGRIAQFGLGLGYRFVAAADPRCLDPTARDDFTAPYALPGSVPDLLPVARALCSELRTVGLAALVSEMAAPALVVFGGRDRFTPARTMRAMSGDVRTVVLPGCGHCPQLDRPEALLGAVLPFLAEAPVAQPVGVAVPA
jgi:pimeloyl-ACP methyl ester carboxylesterase